LDALVSKIHAAAVVNFRIIANNYSCKLPDVITETL